ncbi:MAG: SpoIIE family protein phosphatase [Gemmatimonadota bacterium]|nr:MAG: SpoIIE family protein phosphatase [Gemmatimonadota bacterium]
MLLRLTELSQEPLYKQLIAQLSERISNGELSIGAVLPTIGKMARKHHVNMNTVRRAYNELEKVGFIQRKGEDSAVVTFSPPRLGRISAGHKSITLHSLTGTTTPLFSEPMEKRELNDQLVKVHQIQTNLLPKKLPENELLSVVAHCHPSYIVGGDFYDCIQIDEYRFGFAIADACGNGLPAAMLISQIQAMLKSELNNGNRIRRILENMNRQVFQNSPEDRFVTFFFGVLDTSTGHFRYVNAGHNYPILMRGHGNPERLEVGGLALGMFSDTTFEIGQVVLTDGDILLFFTDGLTEIRNDLHQEYGEQRLLYILDRCRHRNIENILSDVLKDVRTFAGTESWQDDCTVMLVRIGRRFSHRSE